jgi:cardiolipin synthase
MHVLSFALVCVHCLRNRREATSALLWIFLAWSFPVVGPMSYLYIGIDRAPTKAFKKRITDEKLLAERKAREDEALPLAYWRSVHDAVENEPDADFARELNGAMNTILPDYPLLGGNSITPLVTGDEAFPAMFEAIANAQHHVHLQSFIIQNDETGRRLMDLLETRARAGVIVRLMYDRFGSTQAVLTGLFRKFRHVPNLNIAGWTQANPLKRQFQINLRNHRKILVVDGRQTFCGGINLSSDNASSHAGQPPIRDYHFAILGPIAQELQYTFMRDWYFMTDESPENLLTGVYFPHIEPVGKAMVRLVNSSPASETECIADVLFMSIVAARNQILAVTPYFVPPSDILRALRSAALRGVDVRLVVPRKNNHVYAGLAGRALYEELLTAGVRIFERPLPFMHAKALIVDSEFALVGTANLDTRSLRLNYETNLAVYDETFVNELKHLVLEDIGMSVELHLAGWRRRPAYKRMVENFCSLMTPVL